MNDTKTNVNTNAERALRIIDQETARVVAIHDAATGRIVGAGCLLSSTAVLTCRHVVEAALVPPPAGEPRLKITVIDFHGRSQFDAVIEKISPAEGYNGDLALLRILPRPDIAPRIAPMEFASPLRHSGKSFYALGFPNGSPQGHHASGRLHGADAYGLVQMDGMSPLLVQGGFSGAPVWCPEVGAFVGIIVSALHGEPVAWCIPSRLLCAFCPELSVRFRMPKSDRPDINDIVLDDPNVQLFGTVSNDGNRKLGAHVKWDKHDEAYVARVTYSCIRGSPPPRGRLCHVHNLSRFCAEGEDAYELFAKVKSGKAKIEFYPEELFTIAAIGDGGDTALQLLTFHPLVPNKRPVIRTRKLHQTRKMHQVRFSRLCASYPDKIQRGERAEKWPRRAALLSSVWFILARAARPPPALLSPGGLKFPCECRPRK